METEKTHSKTSEFFYTNWWLFYLLIFILIGLLFFVGCHPKQDSNLSAIHKKLSGLEDQIECGLRNKETEEEVIVDEETPEDAIPCNSGPTNSGGQGYTENQHVLGDLPGNVTVFYDMLNVPDQIEIIYDGQLVASTDRLVSGQGNLTWRYAPQKRGPKFCIVRISAPQEGTEWNYNLGCPE